MEHEGTPAHRRRIIGALVGVVALAQAAWAETPASGAPAFIGSAACAGCHAAEHAAWKQSQHALAMQHARDGTVLGDFEGATFSYAGVESTFFRRDGTYLVRTDGADGKLAEFPIAYTYGIYPLQQYLVAFPDGRLQALSIAWDARPAADGGQRWFHLYPDESVDHADELHWTGRQQNWNFMCADCHSTDVRKNYDARSDTFDTKWSELSVGCEACHGPGSRHRAQVLSGAWDSSKGLTVRLDERRGVVWTPDPASGNAVRSAPRASDREIQVCAQCHARRAQVAEGYHAGRPFQDHYRPALLSPGLYHPDGQQRDEVYTWGSFLQSRMNRAGVTCSDCHDPHSAKLRAQGNAVCSGCHLPQRYDAASHHHHDAALACVDCHMPATRYMVVDPRRDHGLRVPRPDLSVSLGVPNACNGCHRERSAQWADEAVRGWYGRPAQGFQRFAPALAAAASGSDRARAVLPGLAADGGQPAIARATALEALAAHPSRDGVAAIAQGLTHPDPLLRRAALGALDPFPPAERVAAAAPLLSDPVRTVRIEAASQLSAVSPDALTEPQREAFRRAAAEFEQVQRYNADRPEARTALGTFLGNQGRMEDAERELRSALDMAPAHVPSWSNLADLYRARGRDAEAEALLAEGIAANPQSAVLYHARGLARVRLGRTDPALEDLARAAALAPRDARFAYVYAVALNSAGRPDAALAEVDRALALNPASRDLLSAGYAFARDAGRPDQAARYADRLK